MNRLMLLVIGLSLSGYVLGGSIQDNWSSLDNRSYRTVATNSMLCAAYSAKLSGEGNSVNYDKELSYYLTNYNVMIFVKSCGYSIEEAKEHACLKVANILKDKHVETKEYPLANCKLGILDRAATKACAVSSDAYYQKFIIPLVINRSNRTKTEGDFDSGEEYLNYIAEKYARYCDYEG